MTLPVVVDAPPKSRTLGAMVVELAVVKPGLKSTQKRKYNDLDEPGLALANVGNIVPPILIVYATCLEEKR